jgi:manganese transport protein
MVPAVIVVAMGFDTTHVLVLSQVILSFALPLPLITLILFTNRRSVMGEFVNGRLTGAAALAGTAVILALNVVLIVQLAMGD